MLLSIKDLFVTYGAIEALHGISFDGEEGGIVTLIGANGAGKSTTLWSIVRQIKEMGGKVVSGSMEFKGEDLSKYSPHDVVNKLGITPVPEGRRVFGNMSVLENLKIAAFGRKDKEDVAQDLKRVFGIFPRLEERKSQLADLLSGGEQQMLAVGRSLMNRGSLMLLDEPSMGLAPILVQELFENLATINKEGTTILLVEQNAHLALRYTTKAYVLETGTITLSGSSEEVGKNPEVKKAYLGG